jgi:hypothetical protein
MVPCLSACLQATAKLPTRQLSSVPQLNKAALKTHEYFETKQITNAESKEYHTPSPAPLAMAMLLHI